MIGARPIIGGQSPVGPQPAPVGTGTATSQTTAPQDDSSRGSASLRIGEVLHVTATAQEEWVEPGAVRLSPAGIATVGDSSRYERFPFGQGACEPLRDRSLGMAVVGRSFLKPSRRAVPLSSRRAET